jgi:hypothetical protein
MKCDVCDRDATLHSAELRAGVMVEHHVCDEHGANAQAEIVEVFAAATATIPARVAAGARCDSCDRSAVWHSTAKSHGRVTECHYCVEHAPRAPAVPPKLEALPLEAAAQDAVLADLLGTAAFIRRHERMPSSAEEWEEALSRPHDDASPLTGINVSDPALRERVASLDLMIDLLQQRRAAKVQGLDDSGKQEKR